MRTFALAFVIASIAVGTGCVVMPPNNNCCTTGMQRTEPTLDPPESLCNFFGAVTSGGHKKIKCVDTGNIGTVSSGSYLCRSIDGGTQIQGLEPTGAVKTCPNACTPTNTACSYP